MIDPMGEQSFELLLKGEFAGRGGRDPGIIFVGVAMVVIMVVIVIMAVVVIMVVVVTMVRVVMAHEVLH